MMASISCHHQKPKRCSQCDRCSRCHYDECNGEHVTERGPAGEAVRKRRRQAKLQQTSGEENVRAYELRNVSHVNLNEDVLFQVHDAALSASEIEHNMVSSRPFERLATLLSLDRSQLSNRIRDRVSLYDLDSLKSAFALQPVILGVETVVKHIVSMITSCSDSFTLIYSGLRDRWVSQKSNNCSFTYFADAFMRTNDALMERYFFAILVQSISDRSILEELIREAEVKALATEVVLKNLKPRYYYVKPVSSSPAEDDDDADDNADDERGEQEEESAAATVKVTLTVRDQLKKKSRWIRSRQKLARALADWERIEVGLSLEPKWNKPRVSLDTIMNGLKFLETLSVGWKGGATQSAAISDECKLANVPVLNVAMTAEAAWEAYLNTAKNDAQQYIWGAPRLGRDSFYTLYGGICKIITDKHALSYYYTGMLTACDDLKSMVKRILELWMAHHSPSADPVHCEEINELGFTPDSLLVVIDSVLEHAKYILRTHVRLDECDGNVMHCGKHATGGSCAVQHTTTVNICKPCQNFASWQIPHAS